MTQYFTYRIKWTLTGMSYYGVRYKMGPKMSTLDMMRRETCKDLSEAKLRKLLSPENLND